LRAVLGEQYRRLDPETIEGIRDELGLNDSFLERYTDFLGQTLRGDLGRSYILEEDVTDIIAYRFPRTFQLMIGGMIVSLLLDIPMGIISAEKQYSWVDHFLMFLSLVGVSMPVFWLALMLARLFGVELGWFPVSGFGDGFLGHLHHLFLPAVSTAAWLVPLLCRNLRAALIEQMESDYVVASRAKGLPEGHIFRRHVLPNSILPTLHLLGVMIAFLIGGSVVVEIVYAVPGLGALMVGSVIGRDYFVVQGLTLVYALGTVAVTLLVDLLTAALDPRVKL
jgi:peptide/nickel transport system permease protein